MNEPRTDDRAPLERAEVGDVAQRVQREAHSAIEHGSEATKGIRHEASSVAERAQQQIAATAEQEKGALTALISDMAEALESAASQLGDKQRTGAAEYTGAIGSGLSRISQTLDQKSVGDIVGDVAQFARTQPTAYLGGALLLGIALARFAKASAGGSERPMAQQRPDFTATTRS